MEKMEFDLKRTFRSVQEAVKKLDKAMESGIEESRHVVPRAPSTVLIGGKSVTHATGSLMATKPVRSDTSLPLKPPSRTERKQSMLLRLFSSDAILVRFKIQQYCERIIFNTSADCIEYSRKAEDILWRKCFYEVILLARRNLKYIRPNSSLEGSVRTHLVAANGIYHSILLKLQNELDIVTVGDCLDVPCSSGGNSDELQELETREDKDLKIWFLKCIHRCLNYLGDLARYQQDFDGTRSRVMAARYYGQAIQFLPEFGMPHNQLGTLAGMKNYGIDAAYSYLRCLLSPHPFDGAQANLIKLFERNHRRHMDILRRQRINRRFESRGVSRYARIRRLKRCLIGYLDLMGVLLDNKQRLGAQKIQQICQEELLEINSCLYFRPDKGKSNRPELDLDCFSTSWELNFTDENRPAFLDSAILFKITMLAIMVTHRLQEKTGLKGGVEEEEDKNSRLTLAFAFTLSLFSHLLRHCVVRMSWAIGEREKQPILRDRIETKESLSNALINNINSSEDSTKHPKLRQSKIASEDDEEEEKGDSSKHPKLRKSKIASEDDEEEEEKGDVESREIKEKIELDSPVGSNQSPTKFPDATSSTRKKGLREEDPVVVRRRKLMMMRRRRRRRRKGGGGGEDEEEEESSEEDGSDEGGSDEGESSDLSEGDLDIDVLTDEDEEEDDDDDDDGVVEDESNEAVGKEKIANVIDEGEEKEGRKEEVIEKDKAEEGIKRETDREKEDENSSTEEEEDEHSFDEDERNLEKNKESKKESGSEALDRELKILSEQGIVAAVKVIADWLKINLNVLTSSSSGREALWYRLALLLNRLPHESDLLSSSCVDLTSRLSAILKSTPHEDWNQVIPLPEDLSLQNLLIFKSSHDRLMMPKTGFESLLTKNADKKDDVIKGLSPLQECVLRIAAIRHFGYVTSMKKEVSEFRFFPDRKIFEAPLPPPPPPRPTKDNSKTKEHRRGRDNRKDERRSEGFPKTNSFRNEHLSYRSKNKKDGSKLHKNNHNHNNNIQNNINGINRGERHHQRPKLLERDLSSERKTSRSNAVEDCDSDVIVEDYESDEAAVNHPLNDTIDGANDSGVRNSVTPSRERDSPTRIVNTPNRESNALTIETDGTTVKIGKTPTRDSNTPARESGTPNKRGSTPARESDTPTRDDAEGTLDESRRQQLMKGMAQLRLKSEVSHLESSMPTQSLSPYLIPDVSAITDHLAFLQKMAVSKKFVLVIPSSIIDELDTIKKSSHHARDSIRWLELQFKNGNRFVRPQNPVTEFNDALVDAVLAEEEGEDEAILDTFQTMRTTKKSLGRLKQLLSCAAYFSGLGDGEGDRKLALTLKRHQSASPSKAARDFNRKPADDEDDDATPPSLEKQESSPIVINLTPPLATKTDAEREDIAKKLEEDRKSETKKLEDEQKAAAKKLEEERKSNVRINRTSRASSVDPVKMAAMSKDVMVTILTGNDDRKVMDTRTARKFCSILGIVVEDIRHFYYKWTESA